MQMSRPARPFEVVLSPGALAASPGMSMPAGSERQDPCLCTPPHPHSKRGSLPIVGVMLNTHLCRSDALGSRWRCACASAGEVSLPGRDHPSVYQRPRVDQTPRTLPGSQCPASPQVASESIWRSCQLTPSCLCHTWGRSPFSSVEPPGPFKV
jgi:hypothetical protein